MAHLSVHAASSTGFVPRPRRQVDRATEFTVTFQELRMVEFFARGLLTAAEFQERLVAEEGWSREDARDFVQIVVEARWFQCN